MKIFIHESIYILNESFSEKFSGKFKIAPILSRELKKRKFHPIQINPSWQNKSARI